MSRVFVFVLAVFAIAPPYGSSQWISNGSPYNSTDNSTAPPSTVAPQSTRAPEFSATTQSYSSGFSLSADPQSSLSYIDPQLYIKPTTRFESAKWIDVGFAADSPFQGVMSLFFTNDKSTGYYCGGALVAVDLIITVAKCAYYNGSSMYDYVHITDAQPDHFKPTVSVWYNVSNIVIVHPLFDSASPTLNSNIAKLALTDPIENYPVIDIYHGHNIPASRLDLVGYGRDNNRQPKQYLRYMQVELVANDTCVSVFGPEVCDNTKVVTQGKRPYIDNTICRVEPGAPLIQRRTILGNRLIGLASHASFGNCQIGNLDVHLYLSRFYTWITGQEQYSYYM